MQGVVVKGRRNLIRPNPHGQPQSALANHASSPRPPSDAPSSTPAPRRLTLRGVCGVGMGDDWVRTQDEG